MSEKNIYKEEEAAKYLGIHVTKLRELTGSGEIDTVYARTLPQTKRPGLPPEDSPQNTIEYQLDDLKNLKEKLEQAKKKTGRKTD